MQALGCVGNSGGGNLTAYIAALDPRVRAAAICCYITTLPRRMATRIQKDPDSDPEQDIFGFVSEGIDHAGLLALRTPRPTLLGTARFDFFPIEGARESFAEAKRLYASTGAGDRIHRVEAEERHGLSKPIRQAVYAWFDRWLSGAPEPMREQDCRCDTFRQGIASVHRRPGQPDVPLSAIADRCSRGVPQQERAAARRAKRTAALDPKNSGCGADRTAGARKVSSVHVLCINGNERRTGQEKAFLDALTERASP